MKEQHTPGKWQLTKVPFELRNTDDAATVYGPMSRDGGACLIASISRSPGDSESEANARLIAAAPELLEALEKINKLSYQVDCTSESAKKDLKEALMLSEVVIKKAKGL